MIFGSALTTGSTHAIIPLGAMPDEDTFVSLSKILENDAKFPNRTSVIWSVREGERAIAIRIWERGAGETLGCGT
ncbi:MAG: diaminopimelate epimerase, partial [Armatimonadota bacterium]